MRFAKNRPWMRGAAFAVLCFIMMGIPSFAQNEPKPDGAAEIESSADGETVWLNAQGADIRDVIKQISQATGRNFIIDDKLRGRKITILSHRAMTKGEAYQAFLSALNVAGYTVVEGPGGILKVVDLREAKQYPIPTHVDTTPMTDSFVTRLVTLRNVGAAEMQRAVRDMISKGGSMSVYAQTNTLIITDSGHNINRLMKIIKELDQEGPQQIMEIVPVKHASAKEVANMVNQLFETQKSNRPKTKPGEAIDVDEVSKLIPDDRTNTIIVLASKRAINQVKKIIARLDQKLQAGEEGRIHVYYLKYAKAADLASTLSSLTQDAGKKAESKKDAGAVLADFEGGIKITADESINALIVTATHKDFQTLIDRVVSKLDVQRRQVYLEAVVMELSINKDRTLGVKGSGLFGGAAAGFGQTFNAGTGGLASALTQSPAPALLGGLISQRTVDITTVSGGTSSTVSIPAFSAFLSALSSQGDFNVVSTPNILTLDNEEATIKVEREEPIPGEQTVSNSSAVSTFNPVTYKTAGLTMKITPQIGYGDMVNLKIDQELSTFGERVASLNAPITVKREVNTNVLCRDGQTIVIGGLMEDKVTNTKQKVPLLGDIPLLGFFFSETEKKVSKSNLLIFITPHVVKDSTDFSEILERKVEQRNRFIEENYGERQQEIIRDSIRNHREDLLEFKKDAPQSTLPPTTEATRNSGITVTPSVPESTAPAAPSTVKSTGPIIPLPAPKALAATSAVTPVPQEPETPAQPQKVITVPSVGPNERTKQLRLGY